MSSSRNNKPSSKSRYLEIKENVEKMISITKEMSSNADNEHDLSEKVEELKTKDLKIKSLSELLTESMLTNQELKSEIESIESKQHERFKMYADSFAENSNHKHGYEALLLECERLTLKNNDLATSYNSLKNRYDEVYEIAHESDNSNEISKLKSKLRAKTKAYTELNKKYKALKNKESIDALTPFEIDF